MMTDHNDKYYKKYMKYKSKYLKLLVDKSENKNNNQSGGGAGPLNNFYSGRTNQKYRRYNRKYKDIFYASMQGGNYIKDDIIQTISEP